MEKKKCQKYHFKGQRKGKEEKGKLHFELQRETVVLRKNRLILFSVTKGMAIYKKKYYFDLFAFLSAVWFHNSD